VLLIDCQSIRDFLSGDIAIALFFIKRNLFHSARLMAVQKLNETPDSTKDREKQLLSDFNGKWLIL